MVGPEYLVTPLMNCLGRWVIAYAKPVWGQEGESVDATSYPSQDAATAAMEALENAN